MSAPTPIGNSVTNLTGSAVTSITVDPSVVSNGAAITPGDLMILTYAGAAAITPADPSGWTLARKSLFGTRAGGVWYKFRVSGETAYTLAVVSSNGAQATLSWVRGVDPALTNLVIGTSFVRGSNIATNAITGVTTLVDHCLDLTFSFEATTASEAAITSATFGSQLFFEPQTTSPQIHTTYANYLDKATAGATGTNTITYPNSSANGFGFQIALPPVSQTIYDISGTVDAVSSATGAITSRQGIAGAAGAVSAASGAVTAIRALAGVAGAVSSAAGEIASRQGVAGVAAAASGAAGAITSRQGIAGSVAVIAVVVGDATLLADVAGGTVAVVTDSAGSITLLTDAAGIVEALSGAYGAIDLVPGVPLGPPLPESLTLVGLGPSLAMTAIASTLSLAARVAPLTLEAS